MINSVLSLQTIAPGSIKDRLICAGLTRKSNHGS